jgi:hypothetical protein
MLLAAGQFCDQYARARARDSNDGWQLGVVSGVKVDFRLVSTGRAPTQPKLDADPNYEKIDSDPHITRSSASPELLRIGMNLEAACFYYGAGGSNGRPSADP